MSLCIIERKLTENTFSIQRSEIPKIQEQGIRCLGKFYDSSLKDSGNLRDTTACLTSWLKAIDNSHLLGRLKVRCFQYGIISGRSGHSCFMTFLQPMWKQWRGCAASFSADGWESCRLSAQSTCTAEPPSSAFQSHRWWKSLRRPRQEQSPRCSCRRMRKSDIPA